MTDYSSKFKTIETNLVHAGAPKDRVEGAVVNPIYQSANYMMGDEDVYDAIRYIRLSNSPNHYVLAARISAIESTEAALVTASGMAAISTTILTFAKKDDHILSQNTLYGGTQTFLTHDCPNLGIAHTSFDPAQPDTWEKLLTPTTEAIYVESISNPLIQVGDLKAVVEFARKHKLVSIIDNTFATPVNFRPAEIGFDIVVHSATKYLNGHSDIVGGVVAGSKENVSKIRHLLIHLGGSMDPHTCFLLERGLKTLSLRVKEQNKSAMALAQFLSGRSEVKGVNYPGLESDPNHKLAQELFSGYGGMLSFYLDPKLDIKLFLDSLTIPLHAASLGGVETLVVRPTRSSHMGLTHKERETLGITDNLIRVSVGIESIDELIEDFTNALEKTASKQPSQVVA